MEAGAACRSIHGVGSTGVVGELVPGHWCSPTAAPDTAAGRTNMVFREGSHHDPVVQPLRGLWLSCCVLRADLCSVQLLFLQHLKAVGQANAYLWLASLDCPSVYCCSYFNPLKWLFA